MSKRRLGLVALLVVGAHLAHARGLAPVPASRGVDTAVIADVIPWCNDFVVDEVWSKARIASAAAIDDQMFVAALHLCQQPTAPTWRRSARNILQRWMNTSKQRQSDAIASIRARLDSAKAARELAQLCESTARGAGLIRGLFMCPAGYAPTAFYFERRGFTMELQKLYWVHEHLDGIASFLLLEEDLPIDDTKIEQELAVGPDASNALAHALVNEALAKARWRVRLLEEQLVKRSDAALLRDTVKRARAQWESLVDANRADIDALAEIDQRLPVRAEYLKGCSSKLAGVVERRLASYGTRDYVQIGQQIIRDPLAAFVFSRMAICHASAGIPDSGVLQQFSMLAPPIAGPRSFAAYALAAKLRELGSQETVASLVPRADFFAYAPDVSFSGRIVDHTKRDRPQGTVRSITKTPTGVRVDLGGTWRAVEIPAHYATGITRGTYIFVGDDRVVPFVKSKAGDKRVIAFYGYALSGRK